MATTEPADRHHEEEGRQHEATEASPLLPRDETEHSDQSQPQREQSASALLRALQGRNGKRRWPSVVALLVLCIVAALIIVFAFVTPAAVEQYAQQAVVFEPTSLSIDSFTSDGVLARILGNFKMDSTKVEKDSVRNLGKFCTWIAKEAETGESDVEVSLPEYGNVLLGTARIPPIKVSLRDQHITGVNFTAKLTAGDVDGIRRIANDWIDGRLGQLRVIGKASVPVRSGIINLGKQMVQQEMLFANKDIPSIPVYKIKKLNLREVEIPTGKGMAADVSLKVQNAYPVDFRIPPLGFGILVDNCEKNEPYIMVADALTQEVHVQPKKDVEVNVTGTVRQLPSVLTEDCPGSSKSPLDILVGRYIHGETNTVYVRGSDSPSLDTPQWITDLMKDITVPVPIPGRTFGHLIKNFSLTDTKFSLPDPWAQPGSPESNPRISANIKALIALPEEMNFNISVSKVRADADVYYKGKKLGKLDLDKWQPASSERIPAQGRDEGPTLVVESQVTEAPLQIQDENVFTDVIQELLFGTKGVVMKVKAEVDVGVDTALGDIVIRKIPADGQVPIKPISPPSPSPPGSNPSKPGKGFMGKLRPRIVDLNIVDTTETSLTIDAKANITNPTKYSASIPYIDIHIVKNGSLLGHATARNLSITSGRNANIAVEAIYAPLDVGGEEARLVGRELISQYISGWNTTITLQMHEQSIPANPALGRILSHFPIEVTAPKLGSQNPPPKGDDPENPEDPLPEDPWSPDDGEDKGEESPHFIKDATMHLFSSTATFLLLSPLKHSTLYLESLNATALYEHEDVGAIIYDEPFGIPPVSETPDQEGFLTPRLPVQWSLGSVGYEAVKRALGGTLKLAARAEVSVRLGRWRESVWFQGQGLGVRIRL